MTTLSAKVDVLLYSMRLGVDKAETWCTTSQIGYLRRCVDALNGLTCFGRPLHSVPPIV